jgi:dTDP-glucose 4,6-dehydratase
MYRAIEGQEIVLHLAALIAIPYSYEAPRSYVRANIEGTLNAGGRAALQCLARGAYQHIRGLWHGAEGAD